MRFQGRNWALPLVVMAILPRGTARADENNPHTRDAPAQATTPEAAPTSAGSDLVVKAKSEVSVYNDTDNVHVFTPAVEASVENPVTGWTAAGSYLVDVVSAASVDIVSTASGHWTETRQAGTLSAGYKPGAVGVTLSGATSREPDYLSFSGGVALGLELSDKTVNPTFAYSYTHDTAGRSGTPFSVFSQELARHTFTGALELILDPSTLVTLSADGIFEVGDQTKPYRFLPMFAPSVAATLAPGASIAEVNRVRLPGRVAEHLPGTRDRFALSGRLAQRLSGSTFILSERLYADDWGLKASSTDLRLVIDASRRVFLWAHLRGHVQSSVTFWRLAYAAEITGGGPLTYPEYRTGDREESALSSGTVGAGVRWNFGAASRPEAWGLVFQADLMTTLFNDALFIANREAYLGVLQLESEF